MNPSQAEQKIKQICAENLKIDIASVENESKLAEGLGGDSLNALEIMIEVEEVFGIQIDETKFGEDCDVSVQMLIDETELLLGAKNP